MEASVLRNVVASHTLGAQVVIVIAVNQYRAKIPPRQLHPGEPLLPAETHPHAERTIFVSLGTA